MNFLSRYPSLFDNNREKVWSLLQSGCSVLLHGCSHSGKKTLIQEYINSKYTTSEWNNEAFNINNERKTVIELLVRKSEFHIELLLKNFGNNEKYVMTVIQKSY